MNYSYIKNFEESREFKIGASEIGCLIPHPDKKNESLNAYTDKSGVRHAMTPIDLYNEKINGKSNDYSFAADMGHYLEIKALYEFIKDNINKEVAFEFMRGYQLHKMESELQSFKAGHSVYINPEPFNNTPFKHNTETFNDYAVSHADAVYDNRNSKIQISENNNSSLKIDLSKPFIIEAKSANVYSVSARKNDKYSGYDLKLDDWSGLPLKVFFQVQFQMAMYDIKTAYVALIYNTNEKKYWTVKANSKYQKDLMEVASYFKNCLVNRTPPKEMAMNSQDIRNLWPIVSEDFREITGTELQSAVSIVEQYQHAKSQVKQWELKERDALDAMSVLLKDERELKGLVNGELQTIARWKDTGGTEKIIALSKIKKDMPEIYEYLRGKKLLEYQKTDRKPEIKLKLRE